MTLTSQDEFNQMFVEMMGIVVKRELPIGMAYYIMLSCFCRIAQAMGMSIDKIRDDLEITFKSLPPPIEEKDEPNQ